MRDEDHDAGRSSPSARWRAGLVAAGVLLSGGCGGEALAPGTGGLSFLRVSGTEIVDESGAPVALRGFQGLGFYPIPNDFYLTAVNDSGVNPASFDSAAVELARYATTEFDFSEIRGTGANVVRLWFNLHELEKRPFEYSDVALSLLESVVNAYGERGIYVILVQGGTGQNVYSESAWYQAHGLSFWDRGTGLWDRTVALWGVLAERFRSSPYVAAYDILNEPQPPTAQALHDFYSDAIAAIRARDSRHIIVLEVAEMNETTFQLGGEYADANLVASFHFYYPHNFTLEPGIAGLEYPGTVDGRYWDRAMLASVLDTALSLRELRGRPVFVGEFGAHAARDPSGLRWIEDVLSLMNERGLHYTYHNYRHRDFQGYWIIRPEARATRDSLQAEIARGAMRFQDLTDDQKRLYGTEAAYVLRPGIREVLRRYF
jgi:hypothetical protein